MNTQNGILKFILISILIAVIGGAISNILGFHYSELFKNKVSKENNAISEATSIHNSKDEQVLNTLPAEEIFAIVAANATKYSYRSHNI